MHVCEPTTSLCTLPTFIKIYIYLDTMNIIFLLLTRERPYLDIIICITYVFMY